MNKISDHFPYFHGNALQIYNLYFSIYI